MMILQGQTKAKCPFTVCQLPDDSYKVVLRSCYDHSEIVDQAVLDKPQSVGLWLMNRADW